LEDLHDLHDVCAAIVGQACEPAYTEAHSAPPSYLGEIFVFIPAAQCVRAGWDKTPSPSNKPFAFSSCRPTVCVTGAGAGVDSAWEQEKLEARKMLENAAESPASSARFVSRRN
jgi:hypothetical protein